LFFSTQATGMLFSRTIARALPRSLKIVKRAGCRGGSDSLRTLFGIRMGHRLEAIDEPLLEGKKISLHQDWRLR
jgi:hypothetical protein